MHGLLQLLASTRSVPALLSAPGFGDLTTDPSQPDSGSAKKENTDPPHRAGRTAKNIHTYNAYNMIMPAVKRIPVTEPVWRDLAEMRSAGQTYTDLLSEMIEDRKKRRLEEDVKKWSGRKKKDYVSLSEIND
ncbi:MAG: hypothetical protein Q7J03_07335 [Methanoregula sp.]|nr:hypothetical protein [Methanoregula sp.]